jgi:hypothetical protein
VTCGSLVTKSDEELPVSFSKCKSSTVAVSNCRTSSGSNSKVRTDRAGRRFRSFAFLIRLLARKPNDRRPDGMDLRMTFAPGKGYPDRE